MNRAFVSLYLIIVLSIILLGVALNKVWDAISPSTEIDPATTNLISVIEKSIEYKSREEKIAQLNVYSRNSRYQFQLVDLNDFASTTILTDIKSGKIINAEASDKIHYYKRIANSNDVLMIQCQEQNYQKSPIYIGFVIAFYSAIAAVIFLWVWPLSRDLARLAQHAQILGKEGVPQTIAISSRSVLFPFATAFNSMSNRLSDLINSQKEMTYAVSHELRTPLARMKFALAMTDEVQAKAELDKHLASIQQDIADMESLINSLLVYAQFEQQSKPLQQKPGHIQDLISDIIQRTSIHKRPEIEIHIQDLSQGEVFTCEWSLMQTALQNLIDNALGYARRNITITLETTLDTYLVKVEDDGLGVPENQRERIFESFIRIYDENTSRSGFGLGLAIVRRIMGWHKGFVVCQTGTLGGAMFILGWEKPF